MDADRHLCSEKGGSFALVNEKLKAANFHYLSKQGPPKLSEEFKSKIERQNFEVQVRNKSVFDQGALSSSTGFNNSMVLASKDKMMDPRATNF